MGRKVVGYKATCLFVALLSVTAPTSSFAQTADRTLSEDDVIEVLTHAAVLLESQLLDMPTARFRDTKIVYVGSDPSICGYVNSKNQFGGYAGWDEYLVTKIGDEPTLFFRGSATPTTMRLMNAVCVGPPEAGADWTRVLEAWRDRDQ